MSWLTALRNIVAPKSRAGSEGRRHATRRSTLRLVCESLEDRLTPTVGDLLQTIYTPLQSSNDQTGRAVAGSDELIAVGTPNGFAPLGSPGQFLRSGSVHVYDSAGGFRYSLSNPQRQDDEFGAAVAIVGGNILVGAPGAGAVYLFDGESGFLLQTFTNPGPQGAAGNFGCSVAAVGNNFLIGAKLDSFSLAGAAYLFDGESGELLQSFQNPTPGFGDQFGSAVTAVGDNVLIGAPYDDTKARDSGAAYLFDSTTGALLRTIINPTPGVGDRFGASLSTLAGKMVIGAQFDDAGAVDNGTVHIFDDVTGALLRTISNPTPGANEQFGCSMAAVGSNLLVGSLWDRVSAQQANVVGGAYLIDGQNFSVLNRFINPTPKSDDQFGFSVAAVGHNILIGAPFDDSNGFTNNGAAYLYDGASYVVPSGNGADDLTARIYSDGSWYLSDNSSDAIVAQGTSAQSIIIVGADDEKDTLTIDLANAVPTAGSTIRVNVSFDGGAGGENSLAIIGNNRLGSQAQSFGNYLPGSSNIQSGRVILSAQGTVPVGSFLPTLELNVGFSETDALQISAASRLSLELSNSVDDLMIDGAIGSDAESANVISGLSAGASITPLTFFKIGFFLLFTNSGNDRVAISDAGLLAEGLKLFWIDAGKGDDELQIASDAYSLPVSGGSFRFDGGPGIDQVSALADADLTLTKTSLASSFGGSVTLSSIEKAFLAGGAGNNTLNAQGFTSSLSLPGMPPPLTLAGGDGDDVLLGSSGDDLLLGGDGDDLIRGFGGINTIDGGDGDDNLLGGPVRDFINGGDGDDVVTGDKGDDIIDGGEGNNILSGGDGNDRITALSGNDEIYGGSGNDNINAGAGQNYVDGGTGDDVLITGEGDDTLIGGTGNDTLDAGDGNDLLDGGSGNNRLLGGSGNDELVGGSGIDYLDGGDGDDLITGGAGNDTIRGGAGNDTIDAGDGNDNVDGGAGNDSIDGGTGNDTLLGGDDNDTLKGGTGIDLLDGGLGFDTGISGEVLLNLEG